jgi:catechol 2,3-dioxygenase-like lactoylglutathione lyase family enzyme
MLQQAKLVGFVATANANQAAHFYSDVLGLELREDTPFALVFNSNGNALRVSKVTKVSAPPYTALGWEVADIATTARELSGRGVTFERFPGMAQDSLGIWRTPDGGQVAWFRDPDGNLLSIGQRAL